MRHVALSSACIQIMPQARQCASDIFGPFPRQCGRGRDYKAMSLIVCSLVPHPFQRGTYLPRLRLGRGSLTPGSTKTLDESY